jgi:hypothetical protein
MNETWLSFCFGYTRTGWLRRFLLGEEGREVTGESSSVFGCVVMATTVPDLMA